MLDRLGEVRGSPAAFACACACVRSDHEYGQREVRRVRTRRGVTDNSTPNPSLRRPCCAREARERWAASCLTPCMLGHMVRWVWLGLAVLSGCDLTSQTDLA